MEIITSLKRKNAFSKIKENGFWFVDIPRTSSTSIKLQLGHKFGDTYSKKWIRDEAIYFKGFFGDHLTAGGMKKVLGDSLWEEIFTFTMVRNPWDRAVSIFNYMSDRKNTPQPIPTFKEYLLAIKAEFLKGEFSQPVVFKNSCYHYIYDGNDIIVDKVIKYENREEELKEVSKKIGFDISPSLHYGKTQEINSYKEHYDIETKEIIELVYAKDIEEFGYSFE